MAAMTIRNLDNAIKHRLRMCAARHGRSMEDEARDILRSSLSTESARPGSLVESIRASIEPLGGIDFEPPPRGAARALPKIGA